MARDASPYKFLGPEIKNAAEMEIRKLKIDMHN